MTELIFSDSGAGALKMAMRFGNGAGTGGVHIITDTEGNETIEPFIPAPYTGPRIDGHADDIAAIWLAADVGDISSLHDWASRLRLLNDILAIHEMDPENEPELEAERARGLVSRLRSAAESGEGVRVWWSDTADEACGFCWAMGILKDSPGTVLSVKVPPLWQGIGNRPVRCGTRDLSPGDFCELLKFETPVDREIRIAAANAWNRLVHENSPLRAIINGELRSVREDFYDHALCTTFPDGDFKIIEAIGRALAEGPPSPGDWWYAFRLRKMIEIGELEIVHPHDRFYFTTLRKH